MTVYNRQRYLETAINSILQQTRQDFELLIWDDGSTDNSLKIAEKLAKKDKRIKIIAAKHQGRGQSLYDAIAATKGEFLGTVDSDDVLAFTALEETANVLENLPDIGWVYTKYFLLTKENFLQ